SHRPRSAPGASPRHATPRAAPRSHRAAAATPVLRRAPASGARRARAASPRRVWGGPASFALGVEQREPPEALAVGEHQPAVRLVVVPDLEPGLAGRGLPLLDLVRRTVADVRATHVRAPAGSEAQEVLLGVAHAAEELDLEL